MLKAKASASNAESLLEITQDSAFVPEKDITDCPTVIIDMAQIAEELRGKNDDSEMETVALRQEEDKLDSAFEDVLNAPAGENAVIEHPVQPANPNQKAGMQPGQVNQPVNAAPPAEVCECSTGTAQTTVHLVAKMHRPNQDLQTMHLSSAAGTTASCSAAKTKSSCKSSCSSCTETGGRKKK